MIRSTVLAAAMGVCACSVGYAADAPVSGRIEGAILSPGFVVKISAIDRDVKLPMLVKEIPVKEYAGTILDDGSRYKIEVPPGEYDLHIELSDGRIVEGADMRVTATASGKTMSSSSRKRLEKKAMMVRTFENEKSILEIQGTATEARVLMKLVRSNPTSYDGKFGEPLAIFRWEVWQYRTRTGSWVRERAKRVLRRFMTPKRKRAEMRWEFTGEYGGLHVEPRSAVTRDIRLVPPGKDSDRERTSADETGPQTPVR